MSKGNTFENDLQKLIFNAVTITGLAQDDTSPLTVLEVALHTANPDETGDQTTSECTYTGYARVPVNRTTGAGGFTVTNNSVSPASNIDFGLCTVGSETATHFSIGTAHTGTGKILYYGTVTPNIVISPGVTPRLTTASTITED